MWKTFKTQPATCRFLFFSADLPEVSGLFDWAWGLHNPGGAVLAQLLPACLTPCQCHGVSWAREQLSLYPAPPFPILAPHPTLQEDLQRHLARLGEGGALTLTNSRKGALPENTVQQAPPPGGWPHLPPARVFVG